MTRPQMRRPHWLRDLTVRRRIDHRGVFREFVAALERTIVAPAPVPTRRKIARSGSDAECQRS